MIGRIMRNLFQYAVLGRTLRDGTVRSRDKVLNH